MNQSNCLTWPKLQTATSRTTERKQFAFCTAKRWDRLGPDEMYLFICL